MNQKQTGVISYFHTGKQELNLKPISESKEKLTEVNFHFSDDVVITYEGENYSKNDLRAGDVVCLEYLLEEENKSIKHIDVQAIGNKRSSCSVTSTDGGQSCSIDCETGESATCTKGKDWVDCACS